MVFTRCILSDLQFGTFREIVGRERQGALCIVMESLVGSSSIRKPAVVRAIGRVSTRLGEDGGQLGRR